MQVKNAAGQWVSAEPIPGTLVCNIGDMLRVWTHGLYQVTPILGPVGSRKSSQHSPHVILASDATYHVGLGALQKMLGLLQ